MFRIPSFQGKIRKEGDSASTHLRPVGSFQPTLRHWRQHPCWLTSHLLGMPPFRIPSFQGRIRKEGDSNPRYLSVHSLSKTAPSTTRTSFQIKKKKDRKFIPKKLSLPFLAERGGFEPPEPFGSTVFETARFDRSRIFPKRAKTLRD